MFRALTIGLAAGITAAFGANEMKIGRTAVLSGSLPTSTTWQVEQQQPGGAWVGTGVIVPGRGSVATVRMDGWPGEAAYRFQRVDGGATVTASLGAAAWHLAGEVPGATQVMIESSANLGTWSQSALIFPGIDGSYVRALREPLAARGFFRSEVPTMTTRDASVASHTPAPNNEGAAGFGAIYDDMPQIFKDGFIGALSPTEYHRGGENAASAGECYELAGPFGRTTLMISDLTTAPPGTIEVGRSFFDIGTNAFKVLTGGPADGALTAEARLVPAPVTGNVKLFVIPGSNIYYTQLRPYNYRAGVSKVELQNNGSSTWVDLPRSTFNSFIYQVAGSVPPMAFPVQVRVTSRFGEVVTFSSIPSMADNQKITGPAQFTVFPDLAPVPEHRVRPTYHDALTNVPGDMWSSGAYGGASVTEVDGSVAYPGSAASLRMNSMGGFAGVTFSQYPGFARPEFGVMKFAIRAASPMAANQMGLSLYGTNAIGGGTVYSAYIQLPPLTTGWQVFHVPLEAAGAPPILWGFSIAGAVAGALPNVWIDEIEFEGK